MWGEIGRYNDSVKFSQQPPAHSAESDLSGDIGRYNDSVKFPWAGREWAGLGLG